MKKILLCVTGSIAAYKALDLTRLLVKANYSVKVVLTKSAQAFVKSLSFEALCKHKVYQDLFSYTDHPIEHIELARWADQILIAPASANTIGKLAMGLADDLLGNVVLATQQPIFVAPAMNCIMWQNNAVQINVKRLKNLGFKILPPDSGEHACGDIGDGRLMAPEKIVQRLSTPNTKVNKCVLITAGPTIEALDSVRYLSNYSSGKMGYTLAEAFSEIGWSVILISGPSQLKSLQNIDLIKVKTADEMYKSVHKKIIHADLFISAAAVADYRPKDYVEKKIKKNIDSETLILTLVKNKDILHSVSTLRKNRPCCVGFAAETHNAKENALAKLDRKKLDFLILNQVDRQSGFPFYSDQNEVQIFNKQHEVVLTLPLASKSYIALQIAEFLSQKVSKK